MDFLHAIGRTEKACHVISENRLRIAILATLVLGCAAGIVATIPFHDADLREQASTIKRQRNLEQFAAIETHLQANAASIRQALAEAPTDKPPADEPVQHFASSVDDLRGRSPSAAEQPLLQLRRDHDELRSLVRSNHAGAAHAADSAMLEALEADIRENIALARGALSREERDSEATYPLPVLALLAGAAAMLLIFLHGGVGIVARAILRNPARGGDAELPATFVDIDKLRDALRHIADWVFICAPSGEIEQVLVARHGKAGLDRQQLAGRSLWQFTSDLRPGIANGGALDQGDSVVTLTSFGATPEVAVAVRLVVARLDAEADGALLAIVRDRSDEMDIEQSFNERTTSLLRARADVERLREQATRVAEEEQERIGRELHDGIGQQLAGISFLSHALAGRGGAAETDLGADLRWLSELAGKAAESVRSLSRQLGTSQFEQNHLPGLLAHLCEDVATAFDIDCRLACDEGDDAFCGLGTSAKRHVFRLAQESLNNAMRHGHAKKIDMRLETSRGRIRLAIRDDGSGFDLRRFASNSRRGLGLHSMRTRASIIGGRLHIRTGAHGTLVMLTAPRPALGES